MISARVKWWIQKKLLGQVGGFRYTGATPKFLLDMVEAFALQHPHATRAEWAAFTRDMAEAAYKAGLTSGWERAESGFEELPSTEEVEAAGRSLRVALGDEEPEPEPDPDVLHPGEAFEAEAKARREWWLDRAGVGPKPR